MICLNTLWLVNGPTTRFFCQGSTQYDVINGSADTLGKNGLVVALPIFSKHQESIFPKKTEPFVAYTLLHLPFSQTKNR